MPIDGYRLNMYLNHTFMLKEYSLSCQQWSRNLHNSAGGTLLGQLSIHSENVAPERINLCRGGCMKYLKWDSFSLNRTKSDSRRTLMGCILSRRAACSSGQASAWAPYYQGKQFVALDRLQQLTGLASFCCSQTFSCQALLVCVNT